MQSTAKKNRKQCLKLPSAYYFSLPRKSVSSPARKTHHRITAATELPKNVNAVLTARYPTQGKNWQQEKVDNISSHKSSTILYYETHTLKKKKNPIKVSGIIGC